MSPGFDSWARASGSKASAGSSADEVLVTPPIRAPILIVDDDARNLHALAEILERPDVTLVQARSGDEALRRLIRQDFALMLLDVQMPELDGYQTAALVRTRARSAGMPIIFLTAYSKDDAHIFRGYTLGAVDYVFKPIDPLILKSKVGVFVELYKKNVEAARVAEFKHRLTVENLQMRTQKLEAERALQRAQERQAAILRALPTAIYSADPAGRFVNARFVNDAVAELTGVPAARFESEPGLWLASIDAEDRERVQTEMARLAEAGMVTTEYRWQAPDGRERHFLDQAVMIRGADGGAKEICGSCLDITERHQLREQLILSSRMEAVGKLTGGIAHDFNNMLTIIMGNLDLLSTALPADGRAAKFVQQAANGAQSCAELTQRLLAFARKQPLAPKVVDLAALLSGMLELVQRSLGEKIETMLDVEPGLWATEIDPVRVESAILNLAINARDAMPDGGRLSIIARNETLASSGLGEGMAGDCVRLSVIDTGTGMSQTMIDRAFDPFFTTKPAGRGTGLGLSMIHGFVRQSGGEIWIESAVGRGTRVNIRLPRSLKPVPEIVAATVPGTGEVAARRILVVEDEELVRMVSVSQLKELGHEVLQAASGAAALDLLAGESKPVDLLMTDVVMPGMSGTELADNVLRRWPGMKVLFTSGYSDLFSEHAAALGDMLRKPFRSLDLAIKLVELFEETPMIDRATGEGATNSDAPPAPIAASARPRASISRH